MKRLSLGAPQTLMTVEELGGRPERRLDVVWAEADATVEVSFHAVAGLPRATRITLAGHGLSSVAGRAVPSDFDLVESVQQHPNGAMAVQWLVSTRDEGSTADSHAVWLEAVSRPRADDPVGQLANWVVDGSFPAPGKEVTRRVIQELQSRGMSSAEIVRAMESRGVSRATTYRQLKTLRDGTAET